MKIAYETPDGRVHVVHPHLNGDTLEEWLEKHQHVIPNDAINPTVVTEIPENKRDRHMWAIEDGKLVVRGSAPPPIPDHVDTTISPPKAEEPFELPKLFAKVAEPAQEAEATIPEPETQPEAEPARLVELPRIPSRQLPDMPKYEAPIVTDAERREGGAHMLDAGIERLALTSLANQIRYEVAMQARNGNVDAMALMSDEATTLGTSVQDLASGVILQRALHEQRIMRAFAIRARVMASVQNLTGPMIDEACIAGADEIKRV